jgi:hypothetical protein
MTSEEFANGPALTGILQPVESLAIFMNISLGREQQTDKWPMPTNLSSSRAARSIYHGPTASFKNNTSVGPSNMRRFLFLVILFILLKRTTLVSISISLQEDHCQNRLYCYRRVSGETLVMNMGILDCAVTLTVDRNVCIQGIVIASQVPK